MLLGQTKNLLPINIEDSILIPTGTTHYLPQVKLDENENSPVKQFGSGFNPEQSMRLQALEEYSRKVDGGINMLSHIGSGLLENDPVQDQGSSGGLDVDQMRLTVNREIARDAFLDNSKRITPMLHLLI